LLLDRLSLHHALQAEAQNSDQDQDNQDNYPENKIKVMAQQ
jgi:hypothetical protein